MSAGGRDNNRLVDVQLDESIGRSTPDVEHERAVAIFDLIEDNSFRPVGDTEPGPYRLKLSLVDARLVFAITRDSGADVATHILSLTPLRRIVKDYYMICESYYEAIRSSTPSKIEAIDMGRRGLHNEGSQTLMTRLDGKIEIDFDTARRLFTLVCVLHWRGQSLDAAPAIPKSVLFMCRMNAVRSPIAEVLARKMLPPTTFVSSAGVRAGVPDPFVDAVLAEEGLSLKDRLPRTLEELEDDYFDLIITLAPEAHHAALELTRSMAIDVEYWPTMDPTTISGTRDQIMHAYRDMRDRLKARIAARFAQSPTK